MRAVAVAALIAGQYPAHAQTFPQIYVFGEDDSDAINECNVTHSSAVAAIQSQLRHNNVDVDYVGSSKSLRMYVTLVGGNVEGSTCAIGHRLQLMEFQYIESSTTGQSRFATVEYCSKSGLLSGPSAGMQVRINDAARLSVDECLSKWASKAN